MEPEIIDSVINSPEEVTRVSIDRWIANEEVDNKTLKKLFLKIYDLNDFSELGQANKGFMGWLNRQSNKKRNRRFFKRLKKDINIKKVYVEGDSWFQHPLIRDLFDQIDRLSGKKYAMYSSAMGGEWWINIIERGEYLPEISTIQPDVILLSGSGNDIVGKRKISNLIKVDDGYLKDEFKDLTRSNFHEKITRHHYLGRILNQEDDALSNEQKDSIIFSLQILAKEFYSLIWSFELMYKYVITKINKKFEDVKIITHGYDYPIPSYKKGPWPKKFLINVFLKNGHWLSDALNLAGIEKPHQKKVTFTLIYFFNEMLLSLTRESELLGNNVHHIDARGAAKGSIKNWYDEMHLKPRIFKDIARLYIQCIDREGEGPKVYGV